MNFSGARATGVGGVAFASLGQGDWVAVAPRAAGFPVGGWIGPALARRLPGRALRILVAVCGLAVAVELALTAYN